MDNKELKKLADNLHLIVLPCTLWAFHIDPEYDFIAVLHVNLVNLTKLNIDKGILLTSDFNGIKASIFVNNFLIEMPNLTPNVEAVSDLAFLIYALHDLKLCKNSEDQTNSPECLKYVDRKFTNFCSSCWENKSGDYNDKECMFDNFEQIEVDKLYNNCTNSICIENQECQAKTSDENVSNTIPSCDNENLTTSPSNNKKIKEKHFCVYCDINFPTKSQLKNHIISHTGKKPFVCTICNKTNTHKSSHKRHMLTHSGIKPNLCNVCGKTFCTGYRIEDHMLVHTEEKRYECNVCKKTFSRSYNLKLHQKTHTGERPYICSICGKTYTTKSNLSTHTMSVHSTQKPHQCNSCNMSFVHPRHLKIHMRKHTGEKPYKCSICGKAFTKNIHLTIHIRRHTGERPHVCSICGKGFTTTGNLNSHKKIHVKETYDV